MPFSFSNRPPCSHTQQITQAAKYIQPPWKKLISFLFFSITGKSMYAQRHSAPASSKLGVSEVELARISRRLKH